MDDARIRQLAEEVLSQLHSPAGAEPSHLESRVAALEAAVRELQARFPQASSATAASATVVVAHAESVSALAGVSHPALALLGPSGGGKGACVLEPDKPCVGSGQCRTFGH